jgi:hypothetical protein
VLTTSVGIALQCLQGKLPILDLGVSVIGTILTTSQQGRP